MNSPPAAARVASLSAAVQLLAVLTLLLCSCCGTTAHAQAAKVGIFDIIVQNFHLSPVGTSQKFTHVNNGCDRVEVEVTVGPKFWAIDVRNLYSCDCSSGNPADCQPPKGPWPLVVINPFQVTFTDISTSAYYDLPTRHNAPATLSTASTVLSIPEAVDKEQCTSRVRVRLDFREAPKMDMFTVTTGSYDSGFPATYGASPAPGPRAQALSTNNPGRKVLGFRPYRHIWRSANHQSNMHFIIDRKRPYPPYRAEVWARCCASYYYYSCPYSLRKTWSESLVQLDESSSPTWTSCCHSSSSGDCISKTWYMRTTFYELSRTYVTTHRYDEYTDPADDNVTVLFSEPEGSSVIISPADDTEGMQFRFLKLEIGPDTEQLLSDPGGVGYLATNRILAVQILQPYPISGLWFEVYDRCGSVMFMTQEEHLPYVAKDKEGQITYLFAVNHYNNYSHPESTSIYSSRCWAGIRLKARYNRRMKYGDSPEEVKSKLMLRWLTDLGSSVTSVKSPIPPTILIKPLLMGAVAANPIANNSEVAQINSFGILNSTSASKFYNVSLLPRLTSNTNWTDYIQEIRNNVTFWPLAERQLHISLFILLSAVDPDTQSLSYFPMYDAFHPQRSAEHPVFYDNALMSVLLGFSEIPRLMQQDMDLWAWEHDILNETFPWWKQEISLYRYQNIRSWTRATGYWDGGVQWEDTYKLIPGPSTWRRFGDPNVRLVYDSEDDARLEAMLPINTDEELVLDYNSKHWDLISYFIAYGGVSPECDEAVTIPDTNYILIDSDSSRARIASDFAILYNTTYKAGLFALIGHMQDKLGTLPLIVNGLGSDPAIVTMATTILASERNVLGAQIPKAWSEYNSLP